MDGNLHVSEHLICMTTSVDMVFIRVFETQKFGNEMMKINFKNETERKK